MGFWKTVAAGLLVVALTKVFESGVLPSSLDWLTNIAAIAWSNFNRPVALPIWVLAATFVLITKLFSEMFSLREQRDTALKQNSEAPKVLGAADPKSTEPAVKEPRGFFAAPGPVAEMKLSEDEETILAALTQFGDSAEARKLFQKTGLTQFRFEHAVGSLNNNFLINDASGYGGRGISFRQTGREYAALHNLDKRT